MSHICDDLSRDQFNLASFAAALSRATDPCRAFDVLAASLRAMGFQDVSLTIEDHALSGAGVGEPLDGFWTTLGDDRRGRLRRVGFGRHDPVRRFARRVGDPFAWSREGWFGQDGAALLPDLRAARIDAGLTAPVWGRGRRLAIADAFAPSAHIDALPAFAADAVFLATAQAFRVIERMTVQHAQPVLTMREIEILDLSARGLSARAIAAQLGIVEPTVKFHLKSVREKLKVRNTAEAVARFIALGPASFEAVHRMHEFI